MKNGFRNTASSVTVRFEEFWKRFITKNKPFNQQPAISRFQSHSVPEKFRFQNSIPFQTNFGLKISFHSIGWKFGMECMVLDQESTSFTKSRMFINRVSRKARKTDLLSNKFPTV